MNKLDSACLGMVNEYQALRDGNPASLGLFSARISKVRCKCIASFERYERLTVIAR